MADRKPLKVLPDGGGDSTGLAEFVAADTIGVADGGTGLTTVATSNLLTGNGTSALSAEANLTFDGSTLTVTGDTVIANGSGLNIGHATQLTVREIVPEFQQLGTGAGDGAMVLGAFGNVNPRILGLRSANTSIGSHTAAGDNATALELVGCVDDGTDYNAQIGMIQITTDAAADGTNTLGRIVFSTTGSGQSPTERMRIKSTGTVLLTNSTLSLDVDCPNTSFASATNRWNVDRSVNGAFNHLVAYANEYADLQVRLSGDGSGYIDGAWNGSGADYQEWFESLDGTEYEVGRAVVLDGDRVRVYNAATDAADNIFGVTRPQADNKNSAVIGNTAWNHWTEKYLTDDWGVYIREDVTVWEWDAVEATESDEAIPLGSAYEYKQPDGWTPPAGATSSTQSIRKINPDYNKPNLSDEHDAWDDEGYIPRADRAEWNLIGLLGQVQIKANEPTNPRWIKMKNISDAVELWMIR